MERYEGSLVQFSLDLPEWSRHNDSDTFKGALIVYCVKSPEGPTNSKRKIFFLWRKIGFSKLIRKVHNKF